MKEINTGEDLNPSIKDHDEILKKIEEIKKFERKFLEFDISEKKPKEELIEVDEKLEEFDDAINEIIEQPKKIKINFFDKFKKKLSIRFDTSPTVFHLRIKNEKLENIDIKKPIVKEGKKKFFSFKRNKEDKQKESVKEVKSTILSKIKGGIGRIKLAIPSRNKKSKDEKETTE